MKILLVLSLILVHVVILPSCRIIPEQERKPNIILDVDMSVDDMMSILYFLSCPDIVIKAITVENGVSTVDSGAEIVLRLLNLTGHPEIRVAKGTGQPLAGGNAFPAQWRPSVSRPFGLELPPHELKLSEPDAATTITQLINAHKNDITIMALGPMTNIAQVLLNDPGLAKNINQIYISDGAVDVEGGIYQEWPQINNCVSGWNLWVDARAAGIVFSCGAPVVLVPLDLTALHGKDPLVLTENFVQKYKRQATGTIGQNMAVLMENWLRYYVYNQQTEITIKGVPIWDVVACMIFHHPEIGTRWEDRHVRIEEGAPETAGQIVTVEKGTPNVRICFKGDQTLMDSLLLMTTGK